MPTLLDALNWRYATKQFDTTKQLTADQLSQLTEALRLSASSFGLQPWKFIVVSNPELRLKLRAAAWDQHQVTDASHLIVLARRTQIDHALVDQHIANVSSVRGVPLDQLTGYADMIKGSVDAKTPEQLADWASRQVYLALGTLLSAAALAQIDSCPMEGFDPQQFDTILDLPGQGLASVVMVAVGFRSDTDAAAGNIKARWPASEVIVTLS